MSLASFPLKLPAGAAKPGSRYAMALLAAKEGDMENEEEVAPALRSFVQSQKDALLLQHDHANPRTGLPPFADTVLNAEDVTGETVLPPEELREADISGREYATVAKSDADLAGWRAMTRLARLDASDNNLQLHDLAALRLASLRELVLACNRLTSVRRLPADGFPKLKTLDLSFNEIKPEDIYCLQDLPALETLNLTSNELDALPADWTGFKSLAVLYLEDNRLADGAVMRSLSTAPALTHLYAAGNAMDSLGDVPTNPRVKYFSALELLDLAKNRFAAVAALQPLGKIGSLRTLILHGNPLLRKSKAKNGTAILEHVLASTNQAAVETAAPPSVRSARAAKDTRPSTKIQYANLKLVHDPVFFSTHHDNYGFVSRSHPHAVRVRKAPRNGEQDADTVAADMEELTSFFITQDMDGGDPPPPVAADRNLRALTPSFIFDNNDTAEKLTGPPQRVPYDEADEIQRVFFSDDVAPVADVPMPVLVGNLQRALDQPMAHPSVGVPELLPGGSLNASVSRSRVTQDSLAGTSGMFESPRPPPHASQKPQAEQIEDLLADMRQRLADVETSLAASKQPGPEADEAQALLREMEEHMGSAISSTLGSGAMPNPR